MNSNRIITTSYNIARGLTPYKSGNWREHALNIRKRSANGFTINYSSAHAHYLKYVEEGTLNKEDGSERIKAQHTIRNTWIMVANYLDGYGNGRRTGLNIKNSIKDGRFNLYRDNPDYRIAVHDKTVAFNNNS